MAERRGSRGFLRAVRLFWRTFWAKRAPWRINFVKLIAVVAVLFGLYLLIPGSWQSQINHWVLAIGQFVASLNYSEILIGAIILLILVGLLLVFVHPYRRATYFAANPSTIPLISVYVDAENQLSRATDIPKFADEVMRYLNGRRANLLFFMDSSSQAHGAQTEQFKMLCRYGFRPVHVPHNPTGMALKGIKEAVDKELAMHAYERALVGPPEQEFIIVTSDQDFVALVYRLAALGHHVQVWATPILPAYRELQRYLDIELLDIARLVSDSGLSDQESVTDGQSSEEERAVLSEAGERQLYRAILDTLGIRNVCEEKHRNLTAMRIEIGSELASRLSGVGYSAQSKVDYWLDHMYATGVLGRPQGGHLPSIGSAFPENAAYALFAVAQLTTECVIALGQRRPNGIVTLSDIANALLAKRAKASSQVRSLLDLCEQSNSKRDTHARYFVRCAQALGLLEFNQEKNRQHEIRSPRLPQVSPLDETDGEKQLSGNISETSDMSESDSATASTLDASTPSVASLPENTDTNTDASPDGESERDPEPAM